MVIAVLWLACRPEPSPVDGTVVDTDTDTDTVEVGAATVAASAWVPMVPVVSFDASADGVVRVERDGVVEREVPAPRVDGRASAAIVGLSAGTTYTLVPVVDGVEGTPVLATSPAPPPGMAATVGRVVPERSDLDGGYLLVPLTDTEVSYIVVYDGAGEPVWWVTADPAWTVSAPRLTRDGRAILYAINDRERATEDQLAVRVELDGSARTEYRTPSAHHMVAELDRGELAWLAWDIRDVPWEHDVVTPVLGDRLMVGDGVGEPSTVLSFFDDRGPAYIPCYHGLLLDDRLGTDVYEWTHGNSVVWIEDTDQLLIVARLLDAVLLVDRTTGDVIWQVGGQDATVPYADPSLAFSHGHLSDAWDGGFLLFDNGSHHEPQRSRVVEYAVHDGVADATWIYDDPEERFVEFLGDARRLPSDNVLIAWSPLGSVQEVTREREVVWELTVPDMIAGRVRFLPTLEAP